jgi:hypothetical protein
MKKFKYEAHRRAMRALAIKAAHDVTFRKQLLADPGAAFTDLTGRKVPEALRVKFVEKDPNVDLMIVLPDLIPQEGELTERDIENVAGGTNWGCQDDTTA